MSESKSNRKILILIVLILAVIVAMMFIWRMPSKEQIDTATSDAGTRSRPVQNLSSNEFDDGLGTPTRIQRYKLDEFGAGVAERAEFEYDINNDGRPDLITRTRNETGTVHFEYVYKIELNDGEKLNDITPDGFYTIEGSDCARQKLQFSFEPDFSVTKIFRPLGDEWDTPTASQKQVFSIWNNRMHVVTDIEYKTVCDVSELF